VSTPQKTVLITGATGLVGSYIAREFAQDPKLNIIASKRATSTTVLCAEAAKRIDWREGDLLDFDFQDSLLREADMVVHAAGLVSYKKEDTKLLKQVNVELTNDLVSGSLFHNIEHFIHVSSIAAISPASPDMVIDESHGTFHPTETTTRYAKSKFEAELHVWRGAEEGLDVAIISPSVVLGAGFWDQSSSRLIQWVDQGQRFYPPGATGYVDVRDVAAFAKTCFDKHYTAERYVLNAENWTYKSFFDAVAEQLVIKPPSTVVNPWQAELAWRAEAVKAAVLGKSPLLTKESARRSMGIHRFDNSKSVAAGATYRPLKETISDVVKRYRETADVGWGGF